MNPDIDAFRRLVLSVRDTLPEGPVLLAELGKAVRDREPQFKPGAYGKENLISLLRLVPDLGTVRKATTSSAEVFVFNEGGAPTGDLPAFAPRIRSDIWKAVIEFRQPAEPWYLDL